MKRFLVISFAFMMGLGAINLTAGPEWIYDAETHEWTDDGDYDGVWICGSTSCQYHPY